MLFETERPYSNRKHHGELNKKEFKEVDNEKVTKGEPKSWHWVRQVFLWHSQVLKLYQ